MQIATLRETANFKNTTNAVSPYTLGQVLQGFATQTYVISAIATATIDPSQIDLSAYAKTTDIPTKLSELTNDDNYVQTVSGKIPGILLPSFVDDVEEYSTKSAFPNPGEVGKLYVDLSTDLIYRWSGSIYAEISPSLALGETQSTAYRGDRGKTAYDHSQTTGNPHNLTLSDLSILATASEINYLSGLTKNIVTALGEKLSLSGGTLTGALTLSGTPTANLHAATKQYVDDEINGIGVTVTANIMEDISQDISTLSSAISRTEEYVATVEDNVTGNILQQVYTKQETDTQIKESSRSISETFTNTINQKVINGDTAYEKIISLEASIERGQDPVTGKPYMILKTGDANGFSLKISNDNITIMQGNTPVSSWQSDKFNVSTVITDTLGIGNFEFVVRSDGGLSFRHKQ